MFDVTKSLKVLIHSLFFISFLAFLKVKKIYVPMLVIQNFIIVILINTV